MGWNVSCAYLVCFMSRILFRMSLAIHNQTHFEQYTAHTTHMLPQHQLNVTT